MHIQLSPTKFTFTLEVSLFPCPKEPNMDTEDLLALRTRVFTKMFQTKSLDCGKHLKITSSSENVDTK